MEELDGNLAEWLMAEYHKHLWREECLPGILDRCDEQLYITEHYLKQLLGEDHG